MGAVSIDTSTQGAQFYIQNRDLKDGTQSVPHDLKFGIVELLDTTDAGDTTEVNLLQEFGITRLLGIMSWKHTTNESVVVAETNTVTVSNGIATVTVGAGTNDDKRIIMLIGV